MVLSSAEVTINCPDSGAKHTPLMIALWSFSENRVFLSTISQERTSPSKLPDINLVKLLGHYDKTDIASEWPVKVPINGLAKIFYILTELTALWYSLAYWNLWTIGLANLSTLYISNLVSRECSVSDLAMVANYTIMILLNIIKYY